MDRRTRICIWVILIGLANFLAFSLVYTVIGGEAVHGVVRYDAAGRATYYLNGPDQEAIPVAKWVYVYSGVHSVTIWLTVGAVMLAMLTLAKERIVSSMRTAVVRGRTLITVLATIITLTVTVITLWFILQFARRFTGPPPPAPTPTTAPAAVQAQASPPHVAWASRPCVAWPSWPCVAWASRPCVPARTGLHLGDLPRAGCDSWPRWPCHVS